MTIGELFPDTLDAVKVRKKRERRRSNRRSWRMVRNVEFQHHNATWYWSNRPRRKIKQGPDNIDRAEFNKERRSQRRKKRKANKA